MADRILREGDVVDWPTSTGKNRYRVVTIYPDGGLVLERITGATEEVLLTTGPAAADGVMLGALPT